MTGGGRRLGRRLGIGRNRLRRGCDRVEAVALWLIIAVLLAAAPLGVMVGNRITGAENARAAHFAATHQRAVAVLHADTRSAGGPDGAPTTTFVPAHWSVATHRYQGRIPVGPGLTRGAHIRIWVDASGRAVPDPPDRSRSTLDGVGVGLGVGVGTTLAAGLVWWTVLALLNRRRLARWEHEWQQVGPRWSRPRR